MKTLYDLARINQKNLRIVESMIPIENGSPLKKLNSLLLSKNEIGENEAMIEIYGKKNISAFSRLKSLSLPNSGRAKLVGLSLATVIYLFLK